MRFYRVVCTAVFLTVLGAASVSLAGKADDVLFQTSTIAALLNGVYDGETTCGELLEHGGFGLGTFNALDGEMVILDGSCYRVGADGAAAVVDGSTGTPFAAVTRFEPDITAGIGEPVDMDGLKAFIDDLLPSDGVIYAIRVRGVFRYVKTRSVRAQKKPYPRLADAVADQPEFEFRDTRGTLVGFRIPVFMGGVNVPGYHFHFITDDKKAGGHLLACETDDAVVEADDTPGFYMELPERTDTVTPGAAAPAVPAAGELERIEGR